MQARSRVDVLICISAGTSTGEAQLQVEIVASRCACAANRCYSGQKGRQACLELIELLCIHIRTWQSESQLIGGTAVNDMCDCGLISLIIPWS